MRTYTFLSAVACCLLLSACSETSSVPNPPKQVQREQEQTQPAKEQNQLPKAGMGIMVGEVTSTSAVVQVRLTKSDKPEDGDLPGMAGSVKFRLHEIVGGEQVTKEVASQSVAAKPEYDYIARTVFTGLKPNKKYMCETVFRTSGAGLEFGPTATFGTLPGVDKNLPVSFVVVTGMNYAKFHGDQRIDKKVHLEFNNIALPQPYAGEDKHLGYPALKSILALKPDFFVGTGDNVYYDTPREPRAEKIPELRQKWHEQFAQQRFRDLFAKVPTYWEIDDHDYRIDDGDNTGDHDPSPEVGRQMMLEQLPVAAHDDADAKTYRTHRVTGDLQIWFVENRMYRSPNAMKDGPEKSIWGTEQKAWLKKTLKESDAAFKILISPNPMIGPDDARKFDNHCNIAGFQHERDEFFGWLTKNGLDKQNFYLMCGDRHWQYHSIHPSGIEEFSCGALVDANARLGRKPGDPKSTDPEKTIKQLYSQKSPSGGFLRVKTTPAAKNQPAKLAFQFYDEQGKLLHEEVKESRKN